MVQTSFAQLCSSIRGWCCNLERVQVHHIGLVKPDGADAKIKFLAAETSRELAPLGTCHCRAERKAAKPMGCVSTCKRQPHPWVLVIKSPLMPANVACHVPF